MIQLIHALPFPADADSLASLRKDWTRFQDGLVILSEIPDAIRGEYECEAEVMKQDGAGEDTGDSEDTHDELEAYSSAFDTLIPSGRGQLILTASKLYWQSAGMPTEESSGGWSVDYKNVLLHAISKPDESRPYIYLQLTCNKLIDAGGHEISFADGDGEDKFVEVNLFVGDVGVADEMFVALSECAALYPCPESDEEIDMHRFEDAAEK